MFQFFPQIEYSLIAGQTLLFTDIFRTVRVQFSNPELLPTITSIGGERPDQLSNRLYNSTRYYWTLFFTNEIKNPFKEWGQSEEAYTKKIEAEYDGFSYQFGNVSRYLPPESSYEFDNDNPQILRYEGTDLSGISVGDLIIVETGNGSYSLRGLGAGLIKGKIIDCLSPHFGQTIIPEDLDFQNTIKQISCGSYFSSVLGASGDICAWGQDIGLANAPFGFDTTSSGMYKSKSNDFSFINATGSRIIGVLTSNGGLTCYGECPDFNLYYGGETGFVKTYWTSGNTGGIGIKQNGTAVHYGLSGPSVNFYDAACGSDYCVGIQLSNYGITGWGGETAFAYTTNFPTGITGFTGIASGSKHNLALHSSGQIYAFGISAEGRTVVPSGVYKKISAGENLSSALDTDDELVVWGKIKNYNYSCDNRGNPQPISVTATDLNGTYSLLDSGSDHIILKSSGTPKKYIGVINSIDSVLKKINAKPYQYPDVNPVQINETDIDPAGSVVSIWRFNLNTSQYEEVKIIQHKLLTIQKYLDSVLYIQIGGTLLDPSSADNWLNTYIPNYKNADDIDGYLTLRKQLMDQNVYNRSQIKYLSLSGAQNLESVVNTLINDQTVSSITSTEL